MSNAIALRDVTLRDGLQDRDLPGSELGLHHRGWQSTAESASAWDVTTGRRARAS